MIAFRAFERDYYLFRMADTENKKFISSEDVARLKLDDFDARMLNGNDYRDKLNYYIESKLKSNETITNK